MVMVRERLGTRSRSAQGESLWRPEPGATVPILQAQALALSLSLPASVHVTTL